MTKHLTQERLRALLDYDHNSGEFYSKAGVKKGGRRDARGYVVVYVDGHRFYAHRLAWLYAHGCWAEEIDHINADKSDNRIANLRAATRRQNIANVGKRSRNTSGYKGVSLHKVSGLWRARILVEGKETCRYFKTFGEARTAYQQMAGERHGTFFRP